MFMVILKNSHGMSRWYESSNYMKNDGGCSKGEMVSPFESRRSVALLKSHPRRSRGGEAYNGNPDS